MTHVTATRHNPDGTITVAATDDTGQRWFIHIKPWTSTTGAVIGWQPFLAKRDVCYPTLDAAIGAALELVDAEYRPSPWLGGS